MEGTLAQDHRLQLLPEGVDPVLSAHDVGPLPESRAGFEERRFERGAGLAAVLGLECKRVEVFDIRLRDRCLPVCLYPLEIGYAEEQRGGVLCSVERGLLSRQSTPGFRRHRSGANPVKSGQVRSAPSWILSWKPMDTGPLEAPGIPAGRTLLISILLTSDEIGIRAACVKRRPPGALRFGEHRIRLLHVAAGRHDRRIIGKQLALRIP